MDSNQTHLQKLANINNLSFLIMRRLKLTFSQLFS